MNSGKGTLPSSGGSILLRSAIVTVLVLLISAPLALLFLSALSGPIGFILIITPMIVLQLPLVWILIRFQLLPKAELGRPSESPNGTLLSRSLSHQALTAATGIILLKVADRPRSYFHGEE